MPLIRAAIVGVGFLVIANPLGPHSFGQEARPDESDRRAAIREHAEQILQELLVEWKEEADEKSLVPELRNWPFHLAEPELLHALQESSVEDRMDAAKRLIRETGTKHKDAIEKTSRRTTSAKPESPCCGYGLVTRGLFAKSAIGRCWTRPAAAKNP